MSESERYLGDGVYARYDGYMLWLDLRGQPDHNLTDPLNRIGLEPKVLTKLDEFRAEIMRPCDDEELPY